MNIHISALIQKMEEELKKAKTAEGDEELKRHVAVVRSLCDVVLDQPEMGSAPRIQPSVTASPSAPPSTPPSTDQLLMEKMMGSAGLNKYRKQEKDKQEEDGNGESLFDF
ncbi:YwdI family protein [Bacillus halotolerans]|uniref:YwdI family protein n=1 Tax=Bacillus halotolerans TaxID=260554 RepID=UPI001C005411|nr:YwdI family protein [Bacillus halotolerans]MBT9248494.1 YwdI family protein [Bacillus halotolerans]